MNDNGPDLADPVPGETPVHRLYRRLLTLTRPESGLTDDERARRNDKIAWAVTGLAHQPAESLNDVGRKLTVVGNRLRTEDHTPRSPFGVQTLLLLDSARADLARLAIPLAGPGTGNRPE